MKRFDFAGEVAKQQITIGTALITVVVTFYKDLFAKDDHTLSVWIALAMFSIFVSVFCGVLSIGGLTFLIEQQERADFDTKAATTASSTTTGSTSNGTFTSLSGTLAQKYAAYQQILFLAGFFTFMIVVSLDRTGLFVPAKKLFGHVFRQIRSLIW